MSRSRWTLATMLAAMIEAQVASPLTTHICGSGGGGGCGPPSWGGGGGGAPGEAPPASLPPPPRGAPGGGGKKVSPPPPPPPPLGLLLGLFPGPGARPRGPGAQRLRPGAGALVPPLTDAGRLAHPAAQVVQPGLPDAAVPHHLDAVDPRRVDQERPLDADAVRHAPHRHVLAQTAVGDADDQALEDLDALAGALHHLRVHPHRVPRPELADRPLLLLSPELLDDVHDNLSSPALARSLACARRQRAISAWLPDSSTSGTLRPRHSAGLVNCG